MVHSRKTRFVNAEKAFEYYYREIMDFGTKFNGCKTLFNIGFELVNPMSNLITTPWRKWSKDYADYEWEWYLSENPNADEISKRAKIWKQMQDENGNVQSNYGWQLSRNNQLKKVIELLRTNPQTRQAVVSIYDGKEIDNYSYDTPCTLGLQFYITENKLNMSVMMRSNDLVYGFCNDQYTFSKYQKLIADALGIQVGTYYHFANNLHIYPRHYEMNKI